ncbi:MAG: helix-turn-helix domain-containing protein [Nitrospira sp.]|nr:helix-turn-helix domain-containing protein [Nitrospira sp.]
MEKHYRVNEVARLTGLAVVTIRKKCKSHELGYSKSKRAILIPEAEVKKLLGTYHPPVNLEGETA